ncbi:response regulator transcription factor [Umezakia ovalisporum]|uniref:Response regulator n=1 Tax=Umezakia ovalisporum FSS-43 TaxID=2740520 RepID=A0ABT6K8G1_9CYAN|nr:response regulator [Umezakia ovalisporum]MDH6058646.1 response regulator [Umezakia ovalisporum FSS-43]MDH6070458.1 response regulator [Umezakia ovalisporum CobakiLakeA]MDH6073971.1 response regulator [Umezakia ovalisporum CS-1034]MDH6080712.1 response regulator [Umezakia ovalisporum FSS-44]MDH6086916.1 response regulator [Umezakia ovalisporum Ak1311]
MKKILIIEDDATTRNLYLRGLKAEGFNTIDAENGLIGIEKAQTYLPDLVVCDIAMPDMDGYTVLNIMRRHSSTAIIPFIFLTGSDNKTDIRKGMELGADDYLTKPSTLEELVKAITIRLEKQSLLCSWYGTESHQMPESVPANTTPSDTENSIFPAIPHLKEVFDYIEANYHRGITLSNVAEAVGYSPAYLTSSVAKKTGETVNGWIVRRRMAAARPLLKDTDQTIEQIATKLGYQNACHFSRQFRQYHGIPPKTWRNQNQVSQIFTTKKPQLINPRSEHQNYAPLVRS